MKGIFGLSERIVDSIYERRRKRGSGVCSEQRLERLRALNPEVRPEETAREIAVKKCTAVLCVLIGAAVLSAVLFLTGGGSKLSGQYTIDRPQQSDSPLSVGLTLHAPDTDYDINVNVDPVLYPEEEIEGLLDQAEEEYFAQLKGRNESLAEVTQDLDFSSGCSIRGMNAEWKPEAKSCVRYDGTLNRKKIGEPAEVRIQLDITLTERGEVRGVRSAETTVRVLPEEISPEEDFRRAVESAIADAGLEGGEQFVLPESVAGSPVTYTGASGREGAFLLLFLGVLAAVGTAILPEQRLRDASDKRDRQLLEDYGEFVSELTVLTDAGLSVRQAWSRMIVNMQADRNRDAQNHYLYREMILTKNALDRGVAEEAAYRDFGRRCGQPPYLRLGSLLETNIRKGTKGLNDLLRQEADDAFGDRMQMARRQGEKISSKLLIPMILLFVLVMIILMVPAFLSF